MWLHDDFYRSLRCKNWSCCLRLPFKGDRDTAIWTTIKQIKTKIEPHNGIRFRVLGIVFEFWEKQLVLYKYLMYGISTYTDVLEKNLTIGALEFFTDEYSERTRFSYGTGSEWFISCTSYVKRIKVFLFGEQYKYTLVFT